MTTGFYVATIKDYDGETSSFAFDVPVLSAANWSGQATARGDMLIELNSIIAGLVVAQKYGNRTVYAVTPAAVANAQRESKMLVQYHDAVTNERLTCEIPCPDLSNLDAGDRAHFNIGDASVIDALVSAFEDYVLSPALNAVVVDELTHVGRRL